MRPSKESRTPAHGKLPSHCECGGKMEYAFDFGRVFSCCDTCTPVMKCDTPRRPK